MYPGKWSKICGDKPAAVNSVTGDSILYEQLDLRSCQLAHCFADHGIKEGDRVAIFLENDLRYFEFVWAGLRSGLYVVPINRYLKDKEVAYILQNSNAKALLTSVSQKAMANRIAAEAKDCRLKLMVDGSAEGFSDYDLTVSRYPTSIPKYQPAGQIMYYSSGTTGSPKGIWRPPHDYAVDEQLTDAGLWFSSNLQFDSDTIYLSTAPLYHSSPLAFSTTVVQACGGTVIMMPNFDAEDALTAIEKYRVTHSQWVPTMFIRLLRLPDSKKAGVDLSSHRVALHAAAPCPVKIKTEMINWWGRIIYEFYGGSEQNGMTFVDSDEWLERPGTVGKTTGPDIYICDENGDQVGVGKTGKIYFDSGRTFSYHDDPGKSNSVVHPRHDTWTTLGDIGHVDSDGYLFLTDRESNTIISGGVNIYPQEIEDVLAVHPKVADVAVIGVPNDDFGEEVKAFVQAELASFSQSELEDELISYVKERMAHYKAPRSIEFVEKLPRFATGKLYKRLLKN